MPFYIFDLFLHLQSLASRLTTLCGSAYILFYVSTISICISIVYYQKNDFTEIVNNGILVK